MSNPLTEGKIRKGGRNDPPTSERPAVRPQREPLPKVARPAPWPYPKAPPQADPRGNYPDAIEMARERGAEALRVAFELLADKDDISGEDIMDVLERIDAGQALAYLEGRDREKAQLKNRLRRTAQVLIEEVGADGPMNAEEAAEKAVEKIRGMRKAIRCMILAIEDGTEEEPRNGKKCYRQEFGEAFVEMLKGLLTG